MEQGDPLVEEAQRVAELLIDLPIDVIYTLSLGTAVRLVASGAEPSDNEIETVIAATWRAITRQ
jgi:hypothetical protein